MPTDKPVCSSQNAVQLIAHSAGNPTIGPDWNAVCFRDKIHLQTHISWRRGVPADNPVRSSRQALQIFLRGADNATISPDWSAAADCLPVPDEAAATAWGRAAPTLQQFCGRAARTIAYTPELQQVKQLSAFIFSVSHSGE